jgi:hypothetical protein
MSAQGALTNTIRCEGVDSESCRYACGAQCTHNAFRFFLSYDRNSLIACCREYSNKIFIDADEISLEEMLMFVIHDS